MHYTWQYTEHALKDLKQLDRTRALGIAKKIATYCSSEDPFVHAKPLQGPWKGLFRFRIGDYRAIFRRDTTGYLIVLLILRVKHRKEVYE